MGASWSGVFGTPSNKSTRDILNTILRRLVTETDMRDMYGLADPEVCKKFVIFGGEAFNKLFMQVRLNKTKEGTLFFQQLKGLGEQNPDPVAQKKNCTELASFFVTIFKIYAAIALSIFDSEFPSAEISDYRITRRASQRGVQFFNPQSGFKGFSKEPQGYMWGQRGFIQPPGVQAGGALENTRGSPSRFFYLEDHMGPYRCLNYYLDVPSRPDDTSLPMIINRRYIDGGNELFIPQSSLYEEISPSDPPDDEDLKRTAKDLTGGVPFGGRIVLNRRLDITGKFSLTDTGTNIAVVVNDIKVDGKDLKESINFSTSTMDISKGLQGEELGKQMHLPMLIIQKIINRFKVEYPDIFIAEAFLRSHGVIDDKQFRGSNIYFEQSRPDDPEVIQISYRPIETIKIRPDERAEKILVKMNMEMKRLPKVSSSHRYRVTLSLKEVETRPEELQDVFDIYDTYDDDKGYKYADFTTDSTDVSTPQQVGTNSSVGQWLERTIRSLIDKREKMDDVAPFSVRPEIGYRQGVPKPYNSTRIPEGLRIADIWKALAKDPPIKPHCMARAMQLLNLAAIKGDNTNAFSRVCDTKFTLIKDGSLPEPGKPITSSYGIKALAMLFLNITDSSDKLKSSDQYRQFRIKFKRYFEKFDDNYKEPADPGRLNSERDAIKDKVMPFCQGHLDETISLDSSMAYQLRGKVNELQNTQARHISNCMGILFRLFDEKEIKAGRFALSDYVWQQGTDALMQLNDETRQLLMGYYTDCEKSYKDGLFILYNTYKEQTPDTKQTAFPRLPFDRAAR